MELLTVIKCPAAWGAAVRDPTHQLTQKQQQFTLSGVQPHCFFTTQSLTIGARSSCVSCTPL